MNSKQTIRALNMVASLFRSKDKHQIGESVARDLYDLIEETTTDKVIKDTMESARRAGKDRKECLAFINEYLTLRIPGIS